MSNKSDIETRLKEIRSRNDKTKDELWLELPGQKSHPHRCPCRQCNVHRTHWSKVITRSEQGVPFEKGGWSRKQVLDFGETERAKHGVGRKIPVQVERGGGNEVEGGSRGGRSVDQPVDQDDLDSGTEIEDDLV